MQKARIALVLAALGLVIAAYELGLFEVFSQPALVKDMLIEMGPWGYVAFLGAYTFLQPFGIPGTVFVVAAPLIWPWPVAFALSMIGTLAASSVGFSFARFVARDWVSKRIPARFQVYNAALEKRAFTTVAILRFVFWMPPLLHAFFGVSKVRFWTHFWGSAVGYAVPLLLLSYFGERLFDALRDAPASVWIGTAVAVTAILVLTWGIRRSRGRRATAEEAPSHGR